MAANNPPTRPLGWLADFIIDNNASQMCPQSAGKTPSQVRIAGIRQRHQTQKGTFRHLPQQVAKGEFVWEFALQE